MASAVLISIAPTLAMVAPSGTGLKGRTWASIESAMIFAADGFGELAASVVRGAEKRLQVTDRDRRIAWGLADADALALEAYADRLLRADHEQTRAKALIPHDEPELSGYDVRQLEKADGLDEEAEAFREKRQFHRGMEKSREARAIRVLVERSLLVRQDANWSTRVLGEIEGIEEGLGGEAAYISAGGFERDEDGGRVPVSGTPLQVISRDGLAAAAAKGGLTDAQQSWGRQYRDLYEKTDPERALRPPPLDPADVRVGRGGEGWADKRAELWDDRDRIDHAITARLGKRALIVLHEVVGKGRCVAHLTSGGRRRDRDAKLLTSALEVVGETMVAKKAKP